MKPKSPFLSGLFILGSVLFFMPQKLSAQQWDTLAMIPASFTFPVVAAVDGKIHVMGGGGIGGATDLHYVYDPITDSWESRASLPYVAQQPAGAAADGKIHFFGGGFPNTGTPLDDHYIYDVATDSWTIAAKLTVPRAIHYSVALDDVIYSLAGQGVTSLFQAYDPIADAWITKNNLPDNQFWYGAHVVTEGHIYRFCGGGFMAPNNNAHRYDPATDFWTNLPKPPNPTHGLRGAAIGDKIFLAGGYHSFVERDEVWIFDTQTETYTQTVSLPLGRNYHNMVAIDSCIYVVGGHHAIDETIRTQLIRLCPYEMVSSVNEKRTVQKLTTNYFAGNLTIQLPNENLGAAELSLFDRSGKEVFFEKLSPGTKGRYETWVGSLIPAIYFVQLKTEMVFYSGKIIVY